MSSLSSSGDISSDLAKNLKCYTSFTPYLYGLPKIHKPNIPIRPIINYKSSPLFKLSKFLSSLLKPLTVDSPLSINSPYQFLDDLKNLTLSSQNLIMVSFDVVSLYTSIPHDLAVDSVYEACLNPKFNLPLSPNVIQKLVSFCLLNNCFSFNNIFYSQSKGTPMGSALSVCVAEIVMQRLENKIVKVFSEKNLFWQRYVDDIFLIVDKSDVDLIFSFSNKLSSHIQFTYELESNNSLPFLDIFIKHNYANSCVTFNTSVHHKNTAMDQYLNWPCVNFPYTFCKLQAIIVFFF